MDEEYMFRCIELARKGEGSVSPNPMVGAVIVHNGKIIGEGYHQKYGEAHAEVNAIQAVKDKSLLPESTLYVNLEPCSHYGKTPPCTEKILAYRIPRVVVGHRDPFPKVSGGGIKILRENGVEVIENVLQDDCAELNKRFFTFHKKQRPYIILKWAESTDGFIDTIRTSEKESRSIFSIAATKKLLHNLRASEAAIMVGTRTALLDNPSLTVNAPKGNNPVRIVPDRELKIPADYKLLNKEAKTIVFTEKNKESQDNIEYIRIHFDEPLLPQIMKKLYEKQLLSLLVEGGAMLINQFIEASLWDEIRVETATDVLLNEGVKSPLFDKKNCVSEQKIGHNVIRWYNNPLK